MSSAERRRVARLWGISLIAGAALGWWLVELVDAWTDTTAGGRA